MPRFLTRNRHTSHASTTPTQPVATAQVPCPDVPIEKYEAQQNAPTSYLVQYDSLPTRNPNGHAIDYLSYKPSRYYVPFANNTPRRPRQVPSVLPTPSHTPASALHLDFDSVSRSRSHRRPSSNTPTDGMTIPMPGGRRYSSGGKFSPPLGAKGATKLHGEPHSIQRAIQLKIVALRKHFQSANDLGDLTVMKRVVSSHRDALARVRRARHTMLVQLHDATTITGLPPPSTPIAPPVHGPYCRSAPVRPYSTVRQVVPAPPPARVRPVLTPPSETVSPVRRVPGSSGRRLASRSVSALKGRTGPPNRSTSHSVTESANPSPYPDYTPEALSQALPSSGAPKRGYVAKLSRKSSGTLKRIGSAGSTLMRRFGRASVGHEPSPAEAVPTSGFSSSMPSHPSSVSSVLDRETLARLKTEPADVIAELEAGAVRLQNDERETLARLKAAERVLEERRDLHSKIMSILDQFYGNLPGWQQDPITQALFIETVDMTDAGLEAERDLAEARHNLSQGHAALKDHELGLGSLQTIGEQLGLFINALERLIRSVAECENHGRTGGHGTPEYSGDIWTSLQQLEKHLNKSVTCGEMASECCPDAPRVKQIERDLRTLRDSFTNESKAVATMCRIYRKDLLGSLIVAKTTMADCKVAECFVQEREKMIAEDVESFEELVERCEEYVMQERMTLVDIHHPLDGCG